MNCFNFAASSGIGAASTDFLSMEARRLFSPSCSISAAALAVPWRESVKERIFRPSIGRMPMHLSCGAPP